MPNIKISSRVTCSRVTINHGADCLCLISYKVVYLNYVMDKLYIIIVIKNALLESRLRL